MRRFAISLMTAGLFAATSGIATTAIAAAQTPPVKKEGEIQNRQERQQKRIGEGLANGSLTPKEAAHLEHNQAKLNKEIRHDRHVNGGNLTNKEKRQINRQQNHLSEGISDKKHNDQLQK